MYLIICKYLTPKGYTGIALFPFIIIRNEIESTNLVLINHEKIHLRQQIELLILPFYILYFIDFLIKIIRFKNKEIAYRNIVFEKEAYTNENNFDYLKSRSFWNWLTYMK